MLAYSTVACSHTCLKMYGPTDASLHICILAHLHPCTFASLHICILAHLHPCTFASLHICILAHLHPCTFASLHVSILGFFQPCSFASLHFCIVALIHPPKPQKCKKSKVGQTNWPIENLPNETENEAK